MEILLIILYFAPMIVAFCRNNPHCTAIAVLNVLLGWTFIGWVMALVWALIGGKK